MRVLRSDDALRKEQVGDEQQDNTGVDEDHGRHANLHAGRITSPYYPESGGHYTREAETEDHAVDDELLASVHVQLEDGHVASASADEEQEEDRIDWDVGYLRRCLAQCQFGRRIWWACCLRRLSFC